MGSWKCEAEKVIKYALGLPYPLIFFFFLRVVCIKAFLKRKPTQWRLALISQWTLNIDSSEEHGGNIGVCVWEVSIITRLHDLCAFSHQEPFVETFVFLSLQVLSSSFTMDTPIYKVKNNLSDLGNNPIGRRLFYADIDSRDTVITMATTI